MEEKGYWIDLDVDGMHKINNCRCSKCNKSPIYFISGYEDWWMNQLPEYCPNCGSEMETNILDSIKYSDFINEWNRIPNN